VIDLDVRDRLYFGAMADPDGSLVTSEFATRDEAKQARDEIAKVIAKAVMITPHG
jgi:hypothetical protein